MTGSLKSVAWSLIPLFACGPSQPAKYPDHDKVAKGQKAWCAMMAEHNKAKGATEWHHQQECDAAYPTASSAFLGRLTPCYKQALTDYGDEAPDSAAIIDKCTHDILHQADPGDVSSTELYKARCARQNRCQQVSQEVCDGAWDRLDPKTRAVLTSMYNFGAQADIASCLTEGECAEDDATAQDDCYAQTRDKLVWLPLSTAHDPSLGPKTD